MPYAIRLPDGRLVENIPDSVQPEEAKKRIIAAGLYKAPAPETTVLGHAKELVKGLIPGAAGLIESAAIGASSLLPEEYEKSAREGIASVASAVKKPFAAAPGYEEAVSRKMSESLGSFLPMLPLGALGLAGRAAAVGLGVGAGAGEARTRAEKEGATDEQRSTATALGTLPGALEAFAPLRIVSRLPDAAKATGVQLVKRAFLAGGEEAAQEAASGFAQNLIAKGVYKPDQELIEGLGEQAAYGGATGAIVQGLLDLAIGRRGRGAAATEPGAGGESPINAAERRAEEAAAEKAAKQAEKAAKQAEKQAPPEIPPLPDTFTELIQFSEQVKTMPKSKARDAALDAARKKREEIVAAEVTAGRITKERAAQFMTAEEAAAAEITPRASLDETGEPAPAADEPAPTAGETTPPAGEPTTAAADVEEPKVRKVGEPLPLPDVLDAATVNRIGFSRGKVHSALVGKSITDPEVRKVLEEAKANTQSAKTAGKIDAFLARLPEPTAPTQEAPNVDTPTAVEPETGGTGVPVAVEPGTGTTPEGVGEPESSGVVPTAENAGQPPGGEGRQPPAVTPPAATPPTFTEDDIDDALAANLITPEQAERARAELQADDTPATAMGTALQKAAADLKAQMDALRQPNGKAPAPKSKNRAKYDALKAQFDALAPKEDGDLAARLEKMGASSVVGTRGERPTLDLDAVRENLTKARAAPKLYEAILNYIGVDADGNYLPTTYSREEAAEMAGLSRSTGANVTRAAQAMGITADVVSRFHAGQTDIIVRGKNVSEAGTGATDLQPTRGVLYEPKNKKQPAKVAKFLRGALNNDGELDFKELNDKQVAEIYARASNYDPSRGVNEQVLQRLNEVITERTKADRKGMQAALDRAYRTVRMEEEAAIDEAEIDRIADEGIEPAYRSDAEDSTRRLSDEYAAYRTIPQSPVVTNRASHAELEKVVAEIEKTLGGKVDVTILDDVTDVDATQKPGSRAGATIKGGIYLFRSGIAKGTEGQKTIFHELFHKGLKNLLPEVEYRAMMNKFYSQSAEIRAMADAYLTSDVGKEDTKNLSPQDARILAVEESLAEVAEQTDLRPTLVRQVGNFLARVADRLGMSQLARAIRTMGLNEQEKFVRDALQAGLGSSKAGEGATRFRSITSQSKAAAKMGSAIGTQAPVKPATDNAALRLRQKFADSMASMEEFFVDAYGGAIRSKSGRLNPMVLLSRMLDSGRVSKAVQMEGGLTRQDGLIVAGELKNAEGKPVSYAGVLKHITDTAKSKGSTYEEYRTTIDEILYGHREFNLREHNRDIEAQAKALEAAGKKPQADKLRENLVELLLTDAQIDAREDAFQNDDFIKGVSADLDTIRFNLLDMLVSTGRISTEMADSYKDHVGYIPFKRIGDYEKNWVDAGRGANRGAAALKNRRNLEGSSTRQSTSVVENFSGLIDWATTESMKNEAATRALGDMTLLGAAEQRDGPPAEDSPGGMARVYENGRATTYYVPDPLHLATFSMTDPQLSGIVKGLSAATRILRAGVTSMPPFAIKQVFDDIVRAYTFAGVKGNAEMVRNILFKFPSNWAAEIFGKKSAQVRELERLGVIGTFDFTRESNLKDVMAESGAQERGIGATILRVMEAGAKASDISVRAAVYQQVLKETGDKAQAESAAREIINFSRRGSSKAMNLMISIVPFFNAYARGMDKMATAMAGGKLGRTTSTVRSMFYKRMGVLTAMGIAYALMMEDDEEYQALPNHVRDTNWILPFGKELGFTPAIPVPPELAFFFKAIPERVIQYYKHHGTEEERAMPALLKEMLLRGVDVFSSPNVTPQLLRPLLENMVNYSFFMGRPLESQAQMELRPSERYGVGTSDAMKALSSVMTDAATATGVEALEISPIKIENFVRGMFGTAAGLGLSVADMALNPQRTDRPLHQQLVPQLTGASALMKNPVGSRYIDEIYSLDRRVTQAYNTLKRLQERDPDKVEAFERDNAGMLAIRGDVEDVMGIIREANKLSITIDRDTSMTPEERRAAIDDLRTQQNDIARRVFSLRKMARDIQAER